MRDQRVRALQYWSTRLARAQAGDGAEPLPLETLRLLRMRAWTTPPRGTTCGPWPPSKPSRFFTCTQQQAEQQSPHTYHSANPQSAANLARFSVGTLLRLACVAQLAEGVNIPDLRVGIIWHSFGNERRAAQRIGRLLRLSPDKVATVHLLVYRDTVDAHWLGQALAAFDPANISYVDTTGFEPPILKHCMGNIIFLMHIICNKNMMLPMQCVFPTFASTLG